MSEADLHGDGAPGASGTTDTATPWVEPELLDPEAAPIADAVEQRSPLISGGDLDPSVLAAASSDEANPADVAEQARSVGTDEDDYR